MTLVASGSLAFSTGLPMAAPVAADPGFPADCLPGSGSMWGCGTLTDEELHQLVGMMTVSEEVGIIHGGGPSTGAGEAGSALGVVRLGIPPIHLTDGPAGVRLSTQETAMPAPAGLTATFDPEAAYAFGAQVGQAGRSTGYTNPPGYGDTARQGETVWLAPMMNQVVVPTAGRNFETLGEDENLAAALAEQLVRGVQDNGLIAQIKHYVDNDFENGRNSASVYIDERTLHEGEMQAFEAAIEAGAGSVMCSYNRVNDIYACSNDLLLNQILKGTLGHQGFVTSDWGATHRPSDLIYGLDMEQPGSGNLGTPIITAIGASATLLAPSSVGATVIKAIPSVVLSTTLSAATGVGDTNIKVGSVTGLAVGQTVVIDVPGLSEVRTIMTVGTSGTGGTGVTLDSGLSAAHNSGVAVQALNIAAGNTITIGIGDSMESTTVASVGTLGAATTISGASTTLSAAALAGDTNVKVASVNNLAAGQTLRLDYSTSEELAVIDTVGTSGDTGTGVTFTAPLANSHPIATATRTVMAAGATNVKVSSVTGFNVGDTLGIGTFDDLETVTITEIGTTGIAGTGVTFTPALTRTHATSEVVADQSMAGTGVTLASPLSLAHPAGTRVTVYGNGSAAVAQTNDMPAVPAMSADTWKTRLDDAVFRMLKQLNNIGELEGTPFGTMSAGCDGTTVPCHAYIPASPSLASLQADHFAQAQAIAEETATLLKNDDNLLPLTPATYTGDNRVLVMGPTAFQTYTGGGGSARVIPISGQVPTVYDSLVEAVGPGANFTYALGVVPSTNVGGFVVPSQGGSATHAAAEGVPAGAGFLREQTTFEVTPAGSAATPCTGDGCAPARVDQTIEYSSLYDDLTLPIGSAWRWTGQLTAPSTGGPWELRVCYGFVGANATDGSIQLYASGSELPANPPSTDRVANVTSASATNLDTQSLTGQCHNPGYTQQNVRATGAGTAIADGGVRNIELRAVANGTRPLRLFLTWAHVGTTLAAASAVGDTNVRVTNVAGFTVGQTVAVGTGTTQEAATIAAIGTAGAGGTGIDLTAPLAIAHSSGSGFIGQTMQDAAIADAVAKASVPGTTPVIFVYDDATEGSDRGGNNPAAGLALPGTQDALVAAVAAVNPNTIVVVNTGDAVLMPWAGSVKSILEMYYPGQRGGPATANVLLGNVNPGGKLPVTFPLNAADYPQFELTCSQQALGQSNSASNVGTCSLYPGVYMPGFLKTSDSGTLHGYRTINFSNSTLTDPNVSANPDLTYPPGATTGLTIPSTVGNGIFTGYRWYDKYGVTPLFEFGRGLSYTTFEYSKLSIKPGKGDAAVDVSFEVKNTGTRAGDEVPQVYVGEPAAAPVPMAVRALGGFQRIHLEAGEKTHVTLSLGLRPFSYWKVTAPNFANDATDDWAVATGCRMISVGSSSRDIRLAGAADETGKTDCHVNGNGHLVMATSAGSYAADPGSKLDFDFDVKNEGKAKDLDGHVKVTFRIGDNTYELKSKAIDSLATASRTPAGDACTKKPSTTCLGVADVHATATLTDVTKPTPGTKPPKPRPDILSGLTLRITVTDQGKPKGGDSIGITAWDGSTLVFSSAWDGAATVEMPLDGGNVDVH